MITGWDNEALMCEAVEMPRTPLVRLPETRRFPIFHGGPAPSVA